MSNDSNTKEINNNTQGFNNVETRPPMNGNDKAQSNRVDTANAWQKFSAEAAKAAASGRSYDPYPPSNYYSNAGGRQNSNYNQPQQHNYQNNTSTSNQQNNTYTSNYRNNTYTTSHQNNAYVNNYQNNTYTTNNQSSVDVGSHQDSTSTMNYQNDTYATNYQDNSYTTNHEDSTYKTNHQDSTYTLNQSFGDSKVDNAARIVNPDTSEAVDLSKQMETSVKDDEHHIKDTVDFNRSPRPIEIVNTNDAIKPGDETNNEIKITANKDAEIKPEDDAQLVNVDKPFEETKHAEEVNEQLKPVEEPEPVQNTTTSIEDIAPSKHTTTLFEDITPSKDTTTSTSEATSAKDTATLVEEGTPAKDGTVFSEETTPVEKSTSPVHDITPVVEDPLPVEVPASLEESTKVDNPLKESATVDEPTPTEDSMLSAASDSESEDLENGVNTPSEEKYIAPKKHMNIVKDFGSMKYPEHITPPIGKSPDTGRIIYEPSFILAFRNLCITTDADLSLITTTSEYNRSNSRYQQSNRSRYDTSRNNSRDNNKQWQHTGYHELERSGSKNRSGRSQKRNNNKQEWWEVNQVTPLKKSENRWIPTVVATDGTASTASEVPAVSDLVPQDIIVRKVKSLLNKLTIEKFDSISTQIWEFAKQSEKEENGESVKNVIGLVFEKAIDEANFASMWALLCKRMYELMGETGDSIKDTTLAQEGQPALTGAPLFRRYLLDICQQGFDKGWKFKVPKVGENEDVMMSDEYYEAVKAKRQGLGLVQFIGELYKLEILTDRVMIQCLIKLSPDPTKAEDDQTESICKLLTTIGKTMESNQTYKEWLDMYFERMDVMYKSETLSSRVKFLIMDVFDLRKNNWVSQSSVQQTGPTTIAAIHEQVKKDNEEKEKEASKRMNSPHSQYMSRQSSSGSNVSRQNSFGGSPRNNSNNRNTDFSNLGYARKILGSSNSSPLSGYDKKIAASDTSRFAAGATSMSNSYSALDDDEEQPTERKKLQLLPRQVPIEPETAEEDSEPELLSDEVIERRCKNIIDEYFSIREMPELCDCVEEELDHPHYRAIFARKLLDVVEKKDEDVDVVCEIIEILYEEQLLTRKEMVAAFKEFWEIYDDLIIDVPKAPEHVNRLLDASGIQRAEVALEQ